MEQEKVKAHLYSFSVTQVFERIFCEDQSRHFLVNQATEIRDHILGTLPCRIERERGIRNMRRFCRSLCRR